MRPILHILIAFAVPFLPLSVMGILAAKIAVEDFTTGDCFTVRNLTEQELVVTPIGSKEGGIKAPLPTVMSPSFGVPAIQWSRYSLDAREKVEICFDYRYTVFSEIVVEGPDGRLLVLVTDPDPANNELHLPLRNLYTIQDLNGLGEVNKGVRDAYDRAQETAPGLLLVSFVFGPWLVIILCVAALQLYEPISEEEQEEEVKRFKVEMLRPWG